MLVHFDLPDCPIRHGHCDLDGTCADSICYLCSSRRTSLRDDHTHTTFQRSPFHPMQACLVCQCFEGFCGKPTLRYARRRACYPRHHLCSLAPGRPAQETTDTASNSTCHVVLSRRNFVF